MFCIITIRKHCIHMVKPWAPTSSIIWEKFWATICRVTSCIIFIWLVCEINSSRLKCIILCFYIRAFGFITWVIGFTISSINKIACSRVYLIPMRTIGFNRTNKLIITLFHFIIKTGLT